MKILCFLAAAVCMLLWPQVAVADCDPLVKETVQLLRSRFEATEAKIRAVPVPERDSLHYRELQEQALRELEALQCAIEASAPPEEVKRGPKVITPFVEVPVLFVTDRQSIDQAEGRHAFFGQVRTASGVAYGRVKVTMPAERYEEGWAIPINMRIAQVTNASAGVSTDRPVVFSQESFINEIKAYRGAVPSGSKVRLLILVHGYNVTYSDATKSAARLAFGLRLNTLPVAISWPSQGATLRYWQDEQSVEISVERFRPVFQFLLTLPEVDEVIVVGHSMGSRLVTRVLSQLELQKVALGKLWRVVFAAADLAEDELRELWARIEPLGKNGWTLYTSSNDIALMASRIIHGLPRVGDSRDRVFSIAKADTIDASAVAPILRGYGHSYVIDNPELLGDLRKWIAEGSAPGKRGLRRGSRPPTSYWELAK
jgi:esterase/lipase superfamily enzyme